MFGCPLRHWTSQSPSCNFASYITGAEHPETSAMSDDESRLRDLEAKAERAYDAMYEARDNSAAAVYSDAKEYFRDAIGLSHRIGATGDAERLMQRLAHVKAVFRSQFT